MKQVLIRQRKILRKIKGPYFINSETRQRSNEEIYHHFEINENVIRRQRMKFLAPMKKKRGRLDE